MSEDEIPLFSEREGHIKPKEMQIRSLDNEIRSILWNIVFHALPEKRDTWGAISAHQPVFMIIWECFLKKPADERPKRLDLNYEFIKNIFLHSTWYEVFNFIEFILQSWQHMSFTMDKSSFIRRCNYALDHEKVQYNITDDIISPLTSKPEMKSVEQALNTSFSNARSHIRQAYILFAERKNPDYTNSMKESISAVESLILETTGEKSLNDKAMHRLEDIGLKMHSQFKRAVLNLYWFSSGTVRHGQPSKSGKSGETSEPPHVNESTARFMLVTCSAFINYIVSEHARLQIKQR